jgi:hypothetical protein
MGPNILGRPCSDCFLDWQAVADSITAAKINILMDSPWKLVNMSKTSPPGFEFHYRDRNFRFFLSNLPLVGRQQNVH